MSTAASARYAAAHATPSGAGDSRPTAMQIVTDEGLVGRLAGRVFLVTGCSSGIGVETARALHATGADVYITVRDVPKGRAVIESIRTSSQKYASEGVKGALELIEMDLGRLSSVRAAAADFLRRSGGKLNVLVANAGVMACPYSKTEDGFETQIGVDHFGHFLLFQLLKDALLQSASQEFPSRVVSVSSSVHQWGTVNLDDINFEKDPSKYTPFGAYGQAKTANIWFANEIERRYGAQHLHATSLMPGGIFTELQRHIDEATKKSWQDSPDMVKWFKSPEQGAATTVLAAIGAEFHSKGGVYLEDCHVAEPLEGAPAGRRGYAPHAYDPVGEKKLWELSLDLTGTKK